MSKEFAALVARVAELERRVGLSDEIDRKDAAIRAQLVIAAADGKRRADKVAKRGPVGVWVGVRVATSYGKDITTSAIRAGGESGPKLGGESYFGFDRMTRSDPYTGAEIVGIEQKMPATAWIRMRAEDPEIQPHVDAGRLVVRELTPLEAAREFDHNAQRAGA